MAIKFRRIEERRESVVQLRRREREKKERWRILPKLMIVVVILVAVAVYFAYFRPPRIVAPFIIHVEAIQVSSPLAGTVNWLVGSDVKEVRQGDVIARIAARPETSDSVGARLTDLRLHQLTATTQLATEEASLNVTEKQLEEQGRQLRSEAERLTEALKRSETEAEQARKEAEFQRQGLSAAESLKSVGAISKDDYLVAKRTCETAQAAQEAAESRLRSLKTELAAALESLKTFAAARESALTLAESRVRGARATCEALSQPVAAQMAAFSQDGGEFVVRAPTSGMLLELNASEKSFVYTGDSLLKLYKPASKVARAYVAVRYRDGVQKGARARLYATGRKGSRTGEVVHVDERVVPLPSSLERRVGYVEANAIPVDIQPMDAHDGEFLPGETGKAVIEK